MRRSTRWRWRLGWPGGWRAENDRSAKKRQVVDLPHRREERRLMSVTIPKTREAPKKTTPRVRILRSHRTGVSASVLTGLARRLQRLPGVDSVTLTDRPPLSPTIPNISVSVPSPAAASGGSVHFVALQTIGPAYFATLGVPLLRGGEFSERDLGSDPAPTDALPAVINQTAARDLFGDADPLGRPIRQDVGDV